MNMPAGYQCIAELSLHKAAITSIAFSSNSDRLAVGDQSGRVWLLQMLYFASLFYTDLS